ncbi:acyl-CoA/acyl-ACP dehydrogenase [Catenulispora sp. NF23]|uniref:acyl-CoA dehydrogenase family protein n=1 Tax=Catenulispora pinistramenti TaxID=2705254 RepID=UPI001BAAF60F|nr:acyl-CoA dehydrogenase family protein [Catenulispora pinistramenti]MBS2534757.1 acyl-CoA/acyl-ACP dehydrogenase [Catenulispora pinistramenti]
MRFDPEQEELRRTVRTLLERVAGGDVWRLLGEQVGALGLAVPEEFGGGGFSVLETHVVLEELGAALAAPGFLSTTLAAQAILAGDSVRAKGDLLPGIAAGETRAAVGWCGAVEASGGGGRGGRGGGGGWRLNGVDGHVLDGGGADLLVVPALMADGSGLIQEARRGLARGSQPGPGVGSSGVGMPGLGLPGVGLFVVDASDAVVRSVETVDPGRPQARVEFHQSPATLLSADAPLDRILDLACVAVSAEQVGAAQRAFDLTLAYAKQRVQFGRPIGSFQAVKHRLADMFTLLESARSASYAAAFAAVSGDGLTVAASRAKAYCSEAFSVIAGEAIQLHGGIGITWEHPIHLYFKRAHATSQLFGTPAWHRRRYAHAVGLAA